MDCTSGIVNNLRQSFNIDKTNSDFRSYFGPIQFWSKFPNKKKKSSDGQWK